MNPSSSWKSCQSGKLLSSSFTSTSATVMSQQRQQQPQFQHPQQITARSSVLSSIDDGVSDYLDMRPSSLSSVESNQSRPVSKPIKIANKKKANDLCEYDEHPLHDYGIDDHDDHHPAIFSISLEKETKDMLPPPLLAEPEPMAIDTIMTTPSGGSTSSGVSVDRDLSSPMTISPSPTPLPINAAPTPNVLTASTPIMVAAPTPITITGTTIPLIDDPGDYATLAPNCQGMEIINNKQQQHHTRHHYAELEFTNPMGNNQTNAVTTRKDFNPAKPLYAQILFPNSNENVK